MSNKSPQQDKIEVFWLSHDNFLKHYKERDILINNDILSFYTDKSFMSPMTTIEDIEYYDPFQIYHINQLEQLRKSILLMPPESIKSWQGALNEQAEDIKSELNEEERRLNEQLIKSDNQIAGVIRTIEIALALATNCHYAYQKVEPELKALLIRTLFKKLIIRDKQIVQAALNEPLDYLCRQRLRRYPVFNLATNGGRARNRT